MVDLMRLPPDRFLNAVFTWALERIPHDKLDEWKFQLNAPLPGDEKREETPEDWEDDGASFMQAMSELTGGG